MHTQGLWWNNFFFCLLNFCWLQSTNVCLKKKNDFHLQAVDHKDKCDFLIEFLFCSKEKIRKKQRCHHLVLVNGVWTPMLWNCMIYFALYACVLPYLYNNFNAILIPFIYRIESKHEVTILGGLNEFCVKFFGPTGSKLNICHFSSVFNLFNQIFQQLPMKVVYGKFVYIFLNTIRSNHPASALWTKSTIQILTRCPERCAWMSLIRHGQRYTV